MLSTNRIYIRKLELSDAEALYELRTRNLKYFQPFEPIRPDAYHTLEGQKEKIEKTFGSGKTIWDTVSVSSWPPRTN
jgi:[ribosomal protein S5]-alanine N-acetyltransferase